MTEIYKDKNGVPIFINDIVLIDSEFNLVTRINRGELTLDDGFHIDHEGVEVITNIKINKILNDYHTFLNGYESSWARAFHHDSKTTARKFMDDPINYVVGSE